MQKLHRPHQPPSKLLYTGHEYHIDSEDLDIHAPYSRPKIITDIDFDSFEISDEMKIRLLLARMKALKVFDV
jgi:hypothetical protein